VGIITSATSPASNEFRDPPKMTFTAHAISANARELVKNLHGQVLEQSAAMPMTALALVGTAATAQVRMRTPPAAGVTTGAATSSTGTPMGNTAGSASAMQNSAQIQVGTV
jgi:hypothetical protein